MKSRFEDERTGPIRRDVIKAVLALPFAAVPAWTAENSLQPTPECGDGEPTPRQTAGPFFKPDSPRRTSLVEPGLRGAALVVSGSVLSTACAPVAGALLDFWHCDAEGRYDLTGFRFRGHQFADQAGRFRLETLLPASYSGRTRHIHVRVQAPHGRVLTTQIYFPGEADNDGDGLFTPRLLMRMNGKGQGRFDFVLPA